MQMNAQIILLLYSLIKKVTLQNLYHDGGFSNVGVSQEIVESFQKQLNPLFHVYN